MRKKTQQRKTELMKVAVVESGNGLTKARYTLVSCYMSEMGLRDVETASGLGIKGQVTYSTKGTRRPGKIINGL